MQLVWTGFLLGFVGSLHCAGMCGPLVVALPKYDTTRLSFTAGQLLYNGGRIATYSLLGLLFGLAGEILSLAALQRWLSIAAGAGILAAASFSALNALNAPAWRMVRRLKAMFGSLLQRKTRTATFLLGTLNGLLPCGLVYVAAAAALATGSVQTGVLYMVTFGLGTLPMMFGISLAPRALAWIPAGSARKLVPACIALVAVLLMLRGMGLGIPYLSPQVAGPDGLARCH